MAHRKGYGDALHAVASFATLTPEPFSSGANCLWRHWRKFRTTTWAVRVCVHLISSSLVTNQVRLQKVRIALIDYQSVVWKVSNLGCPASKSFSQASWRPWGGHPHGWINDLTYEGTNWAQENFNLDARDDEAPKRALEEVLGVRWQASQAESCKSGSLPDKMNDQAEFRHLVI